MSDDIHWIEITGMEDTERRFISLDGTQYRSEPFEDATYTGDCRVEFGRGFGRGLNDASRLGTVALVLSLTALVLAVAANVLRFAT